MTYYFKGATHPTGPGKIHRAWYYQQFDCWGAECQRTWTSLDLKNLYHGRILAQRDYPLQCIKCQDRPEPPEQALWDVPYPPVFKVNDTEVSDAEVKENNLLKLATELIDEAESERYETGVYEQNTLVVKAQACISLAEAMRARR